MFTRTMLKSKVHRATDLGVDAGHAPAGSGLLSSTEDLLAGSSISTEDLLAGSSISTGS